MYSAFDSLALSRGKCLLDVLGMFLSLYLASDTPKKLWNFEIPFLFSEPGCERTCWVLERLHMLLVCMGHLAYHILPGSLWRWKRIAVVLSTWKLFQTFLYASDNRHWLWKTTCSWWRFQYMEILLKSFKYTGIDGYYWILLILVSESNSFRPPKSWSHMLKLAWKFGGLELLFSLTSKAMFQPWPTHPLGLACVVPELLAPQRMKLLTLRRKHDHNFPPIDTFKHWWAKRLMKQSQVHSLQISSIQPFVEENQTPTHS